MIFLSFRFYVKSIFDDSRSAKSAILSDLEALNLDFYEFLHLLKAEIDLINKIINIAKKMKRLSQIK